VRVLRSSVGEEVSAYYNEIDPYAAQWLRNLIKAGHIADGEVDTRSIVDVRPADLEGFTQAHFFAGIGGWSHALRLAGWPDDRPIWTGSCPCQPFSAAGNRKGAADERHLWPKFFELIRSVRPDVIMGEQVAGAAGYGWLDGVQTDLEKEGYATRAVDIPACSVNAPHIRQRLYWVSANPMRFRGKGHISPKSAGEMRPWWKGSAKDLQLIITSPYAAGPCFPQPLLCRLDDGLFARVGRLRAYGNAIVPQVAAEVIGAYMDCAQAWGKKND
jgi:DNA (cytosine-5)-methyltransferase 1